VAEATLLHDIARLGDPGSVVARLATLNETTGSALMAALATHAAAMDRASGAELEDASLGFEALGAWLLAAEARSGAGAAYRAEGLSRRAIASERRTIELVTICGEVRTPGLSHGGSIDRLTRRELEVAWLAASGLSSKEIAARLFVSARTVDNHLQAAYTKLGVTSREELASALGAP
jgi:DNA-binding CsgD family transcriptional regulator